MTLYLLYRIGYFLALTLPLKAGYLIACAIADIYYRVCRRDRETIINNLKIIFGNDKKPEKMAKYVFRNFAKYLVDFFRFSKIDQDYIKRYVRIEGLRNIDAALARKKGAIILSAHIGNWELGGAVLATIGYPLSAVVLTHQNKRINDFFKHQRLKGKMKPIEIGIPLKGCFKLLRANGLLGLLGDRDFTKSGLVIDFFGKDALIPKGPAFFSYRIGSAIIPSFMVREEDDSYRLIFEEPIFPDEARNEDAALRELTKRYVAVMESYIRRYPTQWYIFKNLWENDEKLLRPDTII